MYNAHAVSISLFVNYPQQKEFITTGACIWSTSTLFIMSNYVSRRAGV